MSQENKIKSCGKIVVDIENDNGHKKVSVKVNDKLVYKDDSVNCFDILDRNLLAVLRCSINEIMDGYNFKDTDYEYPVTDN